MAKSKSAASEKNQDLATNLPLFFKQPVPLDSERHQKAGVLTQDNMSFASDTNSIYINAVEFAEAAKYYPIVFSNTEDPMPAVLTGLEKGNYFVGKDDHWRKDTYIPAYVRRYPFVFMEVPNEDKFVLCIDEASAHFKEKGGKGTQPLYVDGKASELSMNALNFCSAFHTEFLTTQAFAKAVKDANLLTPTSSSAKLENGREIALTGFQVINEEKFKQLTDEQILDFHKKGWLPLLYFVLLSASNWRRLVMLASEREAN